MNSLSYRSEERNARFLIQSSGPSSLDQVLAGRPLQIEAVSEKILRIHSGKSFSFAMDKLPSLSGHFTLARQQEGLSLSTTQLTLEIDPHLHIRISNNKGIVLCADYSGSLGRSATLSPQELEHLLQEGHTVQSQENCLFQVTKQLFGDEVFYGLGDKTGFLNKRGYDYVMWNSDNPNPHVENPTYKAMYKSIPFFITLRDNCMYGIFLDNHYKTYFDMGFNSDQYYSFGAAQGELDYYFIAGNSLGDIIASYTGLTGRSPLPQLWTLGYHQSRWSYSTQEEVLELARAFRRYQLPCDAIHLDIDYMEDFKVFTCNSRRFPDLRQLSRQLDELGIRLIAIIDPGVKAEKGYPVYDEGVTNGFFAIDGEGEIYHNTVWPGESAFPDFTSQKVQKWWGDHTRFLIDKGIRGIWNDMNEPASFHGPLPEDVCFPGDDSPRCHGEIHNVYGHLMAEATYHGLKKNDGRRPFAITRACYSGSQKYSTAWTGDNQSLWSHLKMSIPQLLNLGMSGLPFVGVDIGGFGANTTPELLCRWIQANCFAPLFRNHSAKYTRRQEPWQFDTQTLDINRKYIQLRYKFLPYLYDLCYEESCTGLPILRPLVLHYPEDKAVRECNDEYLVGESLLAAPVTDQGARSRSIYLPQGTWVDYWTGERISGGRYILREVPLDICPLYIQAGSIIPTWPKMLHIPENGSSQLILEYYPLRPDSGESSPEQTKPSSLPTWIHYQDNGIDFQYQRGEYNLYHFTVRSQSDKSPYHLETTFLYEGYSRKYDSITMTVR